MKTLLAALALALLSAACATVPAAPMEEVVGAACHEGAYRLADGRLVAFGPASAGALRYRLMNGDMGTLQPEEGGGFATGSRSGAAPESRLDGACGSREVRFGAPGVPEQAATRLPLTGRTVSFASGELTLRGRLVVPEGRARAPVVVLVHGSEDTSAVDQRLEQYWLPAQGVAVFVYDKRGTGGSQGRYTQDFDLLSGDAAAALSEARRLMGPRAGRAGLWGGSQGAWVAPLAALRARADFVVAAYGLAEGPLAEDREEVFDDLRRAGYGEDVLAQAREITDATAAIVASRFTAGFERLEALKARYGREPWFAAIEGEFTGALLQAPTETIRVVGPQRDLGTSWTYDPMPTLRALDVPMLWVLAGEDRSAPSATTLAILRDLQRSKPRLDVALFPAADHGMVRFVEQSGRRQTVGIAHSYQPLVLEWIRSGRLAGGDDVVLHPGAGRR